MNILLPNGLVDCKRRRLLIPLCIRKFSLGAVVL